MSNIQSIQQNIPSQIASQAGQAEQENRTGGASQSSQILSGTSVTVTSRLGSSLERLVSRVKSETETTKMALSKMRLASVLEACTTRYGNISQQQQQVLEGIAANNAEISTKEGEIKTAQSDLTTAEAQSIVMQSAIESLERQVEQAVEDGKIHRERVAKLREQRAADQDNEDLKTELEEEERALEAAENEVSSKEAELATAKSAYSANQSNIETLKGTVSSLNDEIDALEASNKELAAKLDPSTLAAVLATLEEESVDTSSEERESAADKKKAQEKAEATDPANRIREAMDKADAALLKDIEENLTNPV